MRIHLEHVRRAACNRGAGYLEEIMAAGKLDGEILEIPDGDYNRLCARWGGAGDKLHGVLHRIAIAVDSLFGSRLSHCKGCEETRQALNKLFK